MTGWPRVALILALAAAWPAVRAQDAPAGAASAAEAGRKVYISSCQRCHGINLVTSGIGFDLRTFPQHEKERFVRSVNQGLRAMPAWGGSLKAEQLELIWAYVGSVNGWKATP
jgi:mono/diheme cytochrome c family protein